MSRWRSREERDDLGKAGGGGGVIALAGSPHRSAVTPPPNRKSPPRREQAGSLKRGALALALACVSACWLPADQRRRNKPERERTGNSVWEFNSVIFPSSIHTPPPTPTPSPTSIDSVGGDEGGGLQSLAGAAFISPSVLSLRRQQKIKAKVGFDWTDQLSDDRRRHQS